MISIALIGSTGSIGKQVCNVVRRNADLFRFSALVAGSNFELLFQQISEFRPPRATLVDRSRLSGMPPVFEGTKLSFGEEQALNCIEDCDVAFVAATGFAGLKYSLKAIECGKKLALANKETLVCGGELVMQKIAQKGVDLLPVDSEHSAIWQAMHFNRSAEFSKLLLTASGGPFYGYTKEQLKNVTAADALRHPTWSMGAKITVDSATLLNKGFEVIEAKWLYNAPYEKIEAVVHPESIIHSMVSFSDGSVLAQMSYPSMEIPIQIALTHPNRLPCDVAPLNFTALSALHFKPLTREMFPCYDLALTAGEWGDNYPCALNGAGEVAVNAFLNGQIGFLAIAEVIERTLNHTKRERVESYESLCATDSRAREEARKIIKNVQ